MSDSNVLKPLALLAALTLSCMQASRAETIDFNEVQQSFQGLTPVVSGSLSFVSTDVVMGVWTTAPLQEDFATSNAFNGTPYLMDAATFSLQRTDLAPFRLVSFQLALGWYQQTDAQPITLTYELAAGGNLVQTATIHLSRFSTIAPGLDITRLTFSPINGAYVSLDNIEIAALPAPVPEPGRLVLAVLGLSTLGLARRRLRPDV